LQRSLAKEKSWGFRMGELITGIWIAGGFFIGALIIQISGTLFSDWRTHERNIKRIRNEYVLKEKIESFKKIYKITCKIKRSITEAVLKKEKATIQKLIFDLNDEFFLFSNKQTLIEARESTKSIQNILDNRSQIININMSPEEIKRVGEEIGDSLVKIIKAIRRELGLEK
jgi:hypothetical protein